MQVVETIFFLPTTMQHLNAYIPDTFIHPAEYSAVGRQKRDMLHFHVNEPVRCTRLWLPTLKQALFE